jgi:hypothetical protein
MRMRRIRAVPIIISSMATLVAMGAVRVDAQTVRATGPDRVSVKTDGAALGDVIDQLAARSPLKLIALDPVDRGVRVSLEAEDVSPLDAIVLALKSSGLDYAMSGTRLIAGRAKKALESGAPVSWAATSVARETPVSAPAPAPQRPPVDEHDLVQPVVPARAAAVPEMEMGKEPAPLAPAALSANEAPKASMSSVTFTNHDDFGRRLGVPDVPFKMQDDSVVVTQPGFVPYKLRPEVKNRRLFGIADIP